MVSERSKESIRGGRRVRALDENARILQSAGSNKQDRLAWSRNGPNINCKIIINLCNSSLYYLPRYRYFRSAVTSSPSKRYAVTGGVVGGAG